MNSFTITKDKEYLEQDIQAYYNAKYTRQGEEGHPDYLNVLKNTFDSFPDTKLNYASKKLESVLKSDLPKIYKKLKYDSLSVCVVPRAKAEKTYSKKQLLFKSTIQSVVQQLDDFNDGTTYIIRNSDTKTTHLKSEIKRYDGTIFQNNGDSPYVGITKKTCTLDKNIKDKDILLIDDIYTAGVNIDEDAIQALIDKGAKSVTFYAVGACGI